MENYSIWERQIYNKTTLYLGTGFGDISMNISFGLCFTDSGLKAAPAKNICAYKCKVYLSMGPCM